MFQFLFSLLFGATTVASENKSILYLNMVHCKLSLYVRVETGPYSSEQT